MIRCSLFALVGVSVLLLFGCAGKVVKPDWRFEKEAIQVHVRADHDLNLYNSKSHTLYVCFYQLSELNAFHQLTQNEAGIGNLFDALKRPEHLKISLGKGCS